MVTVTVESGTLAQQAFAVAPNPDPYLIDFGSLTTPLAPLAVPAELNRLRVVDTRGGVYGWMLTATVSDFRSGDFVIPASRLALDPACASANPYSAPGVIDAGESSFASPILLCAKDDQIGGGGSTGGEYDITGPMTLTVPSFQPTGTYMAVMTVFLA